MAITQNSLIGLTRQKLGNTVFTTWKGKYILKSKPLTIANPKTDKQLLSRSKLKLFVPVYKAIIRMVVYGFETFAVGKTEYNAFMSYNMLNATTQISPSEAIINFANFQPSQGIIGVTPQLSFNSFADLPTYYVYTILYDPMYAPVNSAPTDGACLVIYNENQDYWAGNSVNVRSDNGTSVYAYKQGQLGDTIHAWLFFKNFSSGIASPASYGVYTIT